MTIYKEDTRNPELYKGKIELNKVTKHKDNI